MRPLELTRTLYSCIVEIVLPPGDEYDQVVRKSEQYSKRAEAIWESRSESTVPAKDVKELPTFERLAQEAQVWIEGICCLMTQPSLQYIARSDALVPTC